MADVVPRETVEGRHRPGALRVLRFLLHAQDTTLGVDLRHARTAQPFWIPLFKTQDATGLLLVEIVDETFQAELQDVVTGKHQQVVVQPKAVDGKEDVLHRAKAILVLGRSVIKDRHLPPQRMFPAPLLEKRQEHMVADNDIPVDARDGFQVIQQPGEHRFPLHLQQRLGKPLGQGIQTCGIACGKHQSNHRHSLPDTILHPTHLGNQNTTPTTSDTNLALPTV